MPRPTPKSKNKDLEESLRSLKERSSRLEELVEILSRGKYMWESTFDAITSPVQIVSRDYEILRANLTLAAVCSKDIAKIIGKKCYRAFAGRNEPCEGCPLIRGLDGDARTTSLLQSQIGDREFEACAYPSTGDGFGNTAILHYRDVTEERRLQREVIQQEKMAAIGMLAGGVAHEINNPLGGIIAFTQLLKRDLEDDKNLTDDLDAIEEAAGRCKKIIADLLDFSRVSKDREKCSVDINVILEKVFPFIRREMQSLNVELVFDGAGRLPPVVGIPDRLQQVFINLMTNACHAMQKGGRLTVRTGVENDGELVSVSIMDTGAGIPKHLRDRIFDPFFTTKEPGMGTGLGLSISYRIIREHGGSISFKDVDDGGTEFIVRLPAAQ